MKSFLRLQQSLEDRYEEICGLKLEIGELRSQQKFGQTQQRKFELVKEQLEARIQQRQQLYEELAEQHQVSIHSAPDTLASRCLATRRPSWPCVGFQETQAKLQEALSEMQMLQQLAETLKNRVEVQRRQMTQQTEQREQERLRLERLLAEEKSQGERQLQELQALHSQSNEHRQRLLDAQQELAAQRNQHRAHERRSQQELETARSEASSWKTKSEISPRREGGLPSAPQTQRLLPLPFLLQGRGAGKGIRSASAGDAAPANADRSLEDSTRIRRSRAEEATFANPTTRSAARRRRL